MWLSPSGQVAHTTLDWRLCRTRIFNLRSLSVSSISSSKLISTDEVLSSGNNSAALIFMFTRHTLIIVSITFCLIIINLFFLPFILKYTSKLYYIILLLICKRTKSFLFLYRSNLSVYFLFTISYYK